MAIYKTSNKLVSNTEKIHRTGNNVSDYKKFRLYDK